MGVDYYNILIISRDASEQDVKRSYKRLAMKWHPDKNAVNTQEAEAKFKQISEAYDVLGDSRKRQIYDMYGEEGVKAGLFSRERDTVAGLRGFGSGFAPRTAEEVFAEFFGGLDFMKERNGAGGDDGLKKATPMESQLPCSLEELYKGSKRKMKISRIVLDESGKPGSVEEVLSIHIKPGWKRGTRITFPDKGNHEPDAAPGDLIFVIDEKPHPVFRRDGNDLTVHRKISLLDALTGKILSITTLDGRNIPLTLSDIVKPGQEMVIENEGMPISKEPGKNGNLRIKFDVKFPSRLSAEQKSDLRRVLGKTAE